MQCVGLVHDKFRKHRCFISALCAQTVRCVPIDQKWVLFFENPATCEVCAVTQFLHAEKLSTAEMYCQIADDYDENIMSDSKV